MLVGTAVSYPGHKLAERSPSRSQTDQFTTQAADAAAAYQGNIVRLAGSQRKGTTRPAREAALTLQSQTSSILLEAVTYLGHVTDSLQEANSPSSDRLAQILSPTTTTLF